MPRRGTGHIERLPSGSYRVWVYAGTDPLTGRTLRYRQIGKTERRAQVVLGRLLAQAELCFNASITARRPIAPLISAPRGARPAVKAPVPSARRCSSTSAPPGPGRPVMHVGVGSDVADAGIG